jgi:hypothetical protein
MAPSELAGFTAVTLFGTAASKATPTFSPPANSLLIVVASILGGSSATGAGATIATTVDMTGSFTKYSAAAGAATTAALHVFVGKTSATPGTGKTATVTLPGTPTQGSIFAMWIPDGFDTASPVGGTGILMPTTSTTPSVTLSTASEAGDRVISFTVSRNRTTAQIPGSGFAARLNDFGGTPYAALLVQDSTGSVVTAASSSGVASTSNAMVALVIKTDGAAVAPYADMFYWNGSAMIPGDLFWWNGSTMVEVDPYTVT